MADETQKLELNVGEGGQKYCQLTEDQEKKLFEVNTAPRRTWPEAVGISGEDAKNKIEAENPDLRVLIMSENSIFTADYNVRRVRVFVGSSGKVTKTPMIG